jgi:glycosyltransferase involved in cell wall biosynthesis
MGGVWRRRDEPRRIEPMTRPRLSIVLCTYNGAAYLQQQLDSLMAQTRLPDEIVISDDSSTDASQHILQAFAESARELGINVQLWSNPENLGYVENFSKALRRATGDVLFLCDQDDVWRSDKLTSMASRFEKDPQLLLLHSDAQLVDAEGNSLGYSLFDALQLTGDEKQFIHSGQAFDVVLRRSFVTGATAALRRELVEMALPVGQDWIHDEWLTAIAAAFGPIDFIEEPLINYRQHDANQIGMRKRTLMVKLQDLLVSRGPMLIAEARRWQRLEDFLAQVGGGSDRAAQARQRRGHFERRVAIGRLPRYQRLLPILREARAGYYRRFGTGGRSMLRDLLRHD